jgi:hypothetical protein
MGAKMVKNILAALDEQTVAVPGAAAADTVLPRLAESLKTVLTQRKPSLAKWRRSSVHTLVHGS